ncbi:hypothetical protein BO85DRAFT_444801 [Aspergillus piperis CBS 112811]|uniref:Uncharacterized protein n=1 Tax=Aspergillus piperis CBS 112811 TaxID=1448313 RepID=A0A8G1RF48_9EURO|nr:hypothetical protein BO85DRAFT_444801 [Aspergillus piperis CBS 112811]RAH63554.1 hypothetical protein BO85DRAFT_444801 [Aspergillus piperis CBS 112811]
MLPRTIDLILPLLLLTSKVQAFSTFHTNCTLPPQQTSFVSAPNTRGTLQILWSSLFTILACTWTVLHLNVPEYAPKPEIKDFKKWLKWMVDKYQHPTKWFLLTVLAPEIPFAKYWDDQVRGHSLFYHYEAVFRKKNWTRTHVLFANMGGFALRCTADSEEGGPVSENEKSTTEDQDDHQTSTSPLVEDDISPMGGPSTLKPIASASCCEKPEKQIQSTLIGDPAKKFEEVFYLTAVEALKLLCKKEKSIPGLDNVSEEEINARSKSDMFMRLLAVGQIVWVVIQILSRWAYGLAVTQLEVTVVAFAFCAVGMYIVNHGKPKGVELPILFEYRGSKEALLRELQDSIFPEPEDKHSKWKFYKCKYCTEEKIQSHGGTSKANKKSSDGNDKNHEPANNNESTDAKSETMSRRDPETNADVEESEVVPKVATMTMIWTSSLDTFTAIVQGVRATLESSRDSGDPIGNGFIDESEDPSKLSNIFTDLWMFIGSMIFGGIHLIAWDFQFPTTVEQYLWWAASLWCTACVLISTWLYFVLLIISRTMEVVNEATKHDNSSTPEDAKPDDPAGQAPTDSSTSPDQIQANPNTELDTGTSTSPKKIPTWEDDKSAPPPEDPQRDIESQDSPPRRWETIKTPAEIALAVLGLSYILLAFVLFVLLIILGVVGMLAYIVARLFIVVEMFRTLAFLPPDAYIATWSSEIPNIG